MQDERRSQGTKFEISSYFTQVGAVHEFCLILWLQFWILIHKFDEILALCVMFIAKDDSSKGIQFPKNSPKTPRNRF